MATSTSVYGILEFRSGRRTLGVLLQAEEQEDLYFFRPEKEGDGPRLFSFSREGEHMDGRVYQIFTELAPYVSFVEEETGEEITLPRAS